MELSKGRNEVRSSSRHPLSVPTLAGKVAFVREVNLSIIPPAQNAATLLARAEVPLIVVEYGREHDPSAKEYEVTQVPFRWANRFPRRLRSPVVTVAAILWFARRILRGDRPTVLVTHGPQEHVIGLALGLAFGIPQIVFAHEIYNLRDVSGWNRLYFLLERFTFKRASTAIFPDPRRAEVYRNRYGLTSPIFVIPNYPLRIEGFQSIDWRSRLGIPSEDRLLGYWGGIADNMALEACIGALGSLPKCQLLLFGWMAPSYKAKLSKLVRENGLLGRVHFLGVVKGKNKWEHYAGVDVSLVLYRPGSLRAQMQAFASNKFWESIALGIPVVAAPYESFHPLLEHLPFGTCPKSFSAEEIANAVRELLADSDRYEQCRLGARRAHLDTFNYETAFGKFQSHLFARWFPNLVTRSRVGGRL